jgi:D-alanine-D-alanine ligase
MGGISAERKISIESGMAVAKALRGLGYNVKEIDITFDSMDKLREERIDKAFIALHGRFGEDGTMQGMLEMMRIPYSGSSHTASAVAMNKLLAKQVLVFNDIPVTPFEVFKISEFKNTGDAALADKLPLVVKPINEGSSIGVSVVKKEEDLMRALNTAFAYDDAILIEKYIKARELQVGVLNNKALGVIEIVTQNEFYDYDAKYSEQKAAHIFPAKLSKDIYEKAMDLGLRAHKALECSGATRVDLLLDENNEIYVLEVNTLPGMTQASLLPEIAQGVDISFPALCEEILKDARMNVKYMGYIKSE